MPLWAASCNLYGNVLDNYNDTLCRAQGGTVIEIEIPLAPTPDIPFKYGSTQSQSQSQSQQTAKAADTPSLLDNITPGSSGIQNYIQSMYIFLIGMVGIIATIVIMIGGLIWISSMGNAARVTTAKDWIAGAIAGLALALFSYMILYLINPDLVSFKPLNPGKVELIKPGLVDPDGNRNINGCCQVQGNMCANTTQFGCTEYGGSFTAGGSCEGNACVNNGTTAGTGSPNNGDCNENNCRLACRPPSKECEGGACINGVCKCSGCRNTHGEFSACVDTQDCVDVCPRGCTGTACVTNPNTNVKTCKCGNCFMD
jgi:hypothetical protein